MSIEITNPLWLLLIPVVAAGLIVSGRYFRMHNKKRKIKYMIVRGIIALLLILTLAGLSVKITTKQITTLFLVDMSDSNEKNLDEAESFIRSQIESMPKKNQVGVVVFGDNVLVDQFITDKKIDDIPIFVKMLQKKNDIFLWRRNVQIIHPRFFITTPEVQHE